MKKFLGIMLGVILIGSFSATKAHAFTLDDLMGQIATLRAEISQLKNGFGGRVLGITSDASGSTDSTGTVTTTTSLAPAPFYYVKFDDSNDCVYVRVLPTKSYVPCTPPSESFSATNPAPSTSVNTNQTNTSSLAPTAPFYYIMFEDSNVCVYVRVLPTKGYRTCGNPPYEDLTSKTPIVFKTLTYGDAKSVDVLNLQTYLKAKNLLSSTPNGTFGPATKAAVVALQRSKGLPLTGVVDAKTRDVINGSKTTTIKNSKITKIDYNIAYNTFLKLKNAKVSHIYFKDIISSQKSTRASVAPIIYVYCMSNTNNQGWVSEGEGWANTSTLGENIYGGVWFDGEITCFEDGSHQEI